MGRFTAFLIERFRTWERPAQIGFLLALVLAFPMLIIATTAPQSDIRLPAAISFIALLIVMQGIFLWANRTMITPFTKAQRAYMAGDFSVARDALLPLHAKGTKDVQILTLLGNTYRQLGDLQQSERILSECLNIHPAHYFPLYGFGRTLLAQGRYAEAIDAIQQGLERGAPSITRFDLAEAHYRAGQTATAQELLLAVRGELTVEPHRALMADYLLYQIGVGDAPSSHHIEEGIPYWQEQAALFVQTPYGDAIAANVAQLKGLHAKE
jgi:tetratricopeptide (TPR) repeat protein